MSERRKKAKASEPKQKRGRGQFRASGRKESKAFFVFFSRLYLNIIENDIE